MCLSAALKQHPKAVTVGENVCGNYVKVRLVAHDEFATKMTQFPVVESGDTHVSHIM